MKKCICIKNLDTPFGSFKKNEEYSYKEEYNIIGFDKESIYVHYGKNGPFEGVRFSVDKSKITANDLAYFYDYFDISRLAKLIKIKSIYG